MQVHYFYMKQLARVSTLLPFFTLQYVLFWKIIISSNVPEILIWLLLYLVFQIEFQPLRAIALPLNLILVS